jgi:putative transposase
VPWRETCPMTERKRFLMNYLKGDLSMSALCRESGISRKTGYKVVRRFFDGGLDNLQDRSRAPLNHPHKLSEATEEVVVEVRHQHASWGPKKIRAWLECHRPGLNWPAASTIGDILKRHGLTVSRRRSRKTRIYNEPFVGCDYPNAVSSADLKGWFLTGDGHRCEPLTISDNYSRFLLRCQAVVSPDHEHIKPVFEAAFREYGIPIAIRTDNGSPFATTTVGGLSRLSIWWLKLGIIPERIRPGHPEQNGRHERMHRTLKQESASPPKRSWRTQQRAFDRFRDDYNQNRPHEALNQKTPASLYDYSPRPYRYLLPEMSYADDMATRRVKSQGDISWRGRHIYLSETLAGEIVGLKQVDDKYWDVYFSSIKLAQLDSYQLKLKHLRSSRKDKN